MKKNMKTNRSGFWKATTALICALTLGLSLTACGGSNNNSQSGEQTGDQAAAQTQTQSTTTSQAEAPEAGTLRTAIRGDITTMDITQTTDDYLIPMNVFDRLFETRKIDGEAQLVNSLCEDYNVSDDGLTYNFTLKSGVVFSNGSALTASDVKYSFERILIAAAQNTDIPLEVVGSDALMNKETDSLEGITVTDDTHFSITLKAHNAGFLAELSSPAMSIVDAETMAEVKNFGKEPADTIGSGPYKVTEWVANDHFTLEYNDKYWGEEPSVKKLIVRVVPDANTQNLMFQNGELDIIDLLSQDSAIVESVYRTTYKDQLVSTPRVGIVYLLVNHNNEYLGDVNVRRAIAMAVDTDTIISQLYNGEAIHENGVIPTGIWAHNDDLEPFKYDPEAAKQLLTDSGYADGQISFEISMDTNAPAVEQLVCQAVSQQLAEVGITATVKSYDHASWLSLRGSGEMNSFVARWGMDYNDPANIMYTFFGSEENTKGRSLNYGDKDIIARVAAAPSIVDDNECKAEYQAIEKKLIEEDVAWIPLLQDNHYYCIGERVASFTPHWAGFSDFYAADVTLK